MHYIELIGQKQGYLLNMRLYVRFSIPKKYWKSANQRLGHYDSARRSAWIAHNMMPIWEQAIKQQYSITPICPTEQQIQDEYNHVCEEKEAKNTPSEAKNVENVSVLTDRLKLLEQQFEGWKELNSRQLSRLKRLSKTGRFKPMDKELYDRLEQQKSDYLERISRQKASIREHSKKQGKPKNVASSLEQALYKTKIVLNVKNRLFNSPVRFHARIHNISNHSYDAPNAYPTIKPLQDAGTRTGILWEDDNNSCIPMTTFQGGEMLSKNDYIIDIIVEDITEKCDIEHIFDDFEKHLE